MKSISIKKARMLRLTLTISLIFLGLSAQSNSPGSLNENLNTCKLKKQVKLNCEKNQLLTVCDNLNINEEKKMLEEWMFDEYFWKISQPEWEEEPIEQIIEIEDWMKTFNVIYMGSNDVFSGFVEKNWMKNHNFLIL